jgi:hypothetical protein
MLVESVRAACVPERVRPRDGTIPVFGTTTGAILVFVPWCVWRHEESQAGESFSENDEPVSSILDTAEFLTGSAAGTSTSLHEAA